MKQKERCAALVVAAVLTAANPSSDIQGVYALDLQLSQETTQFYEYWKEKYLVQNPYVTDETQYYVFYGEQTYAEAGYSVAVTVSEAHGYGMLIAASMASYDPDAKAIFDGLYRFYKAHPSSIGPNLMAWQQSDNGTALVDSNGNDSATDGDMDIAYALLMADAIWGSDGDINYKETAIAVINDIMKYEVSQTQWILRVGDWTYWSDASSKYYAATRGSDFIVQYMPVFAEVTGDDRWLTVYETTYGIINQFVGEYGTGIIPDFIIWDTASAKFVPAPANFLESENDGNCYYNSCRAPWRISMDYLVNGNTDALAYAKAINTFIQQATGGDPWEIMAGYTPDGQAVSDWNDLCFNSPLMVAAACDENTAWHDAVREMCVNYGEDVYYGDTITMLCLIVDDGCWIVPASATEKRVAGDVNADGVLSLVDVIMLQKWLTHEGELTDWSAGDLNADNVIDSKDLTHIKRLFLPEV